MPLRAVRKGDLKRGRILLAGTLGLAGVILVSVFAFSKPKMIYSRSVSELAKQPLVETTVRVEGMLVPGSLCKVPSKCEFRFRLADLPHAGRESRNELEVRFEQCVIPDTFRDAPGFELSVTVEGELREDLRHFDAVNIMAKCPSKYEMPDGGYEVLARPVRPCSS